jgi:YD repeat-containing protein
VGPLSFAWSADDLAERVDTGAVALRIGRDFSGRIRELASRGFSVSVERDEAGLPVRWVGTDGVLDVVRDAAGREIGETIQRADSLLITRDPRGWIDRVDLGKRSWRIDREPGGSVIRVQGPEDLRLGHDFDALGRLTLVRYPSGALGRYRYDGHAVLEAIDGADGKEIQARRYELDPRGLRLSALDTAGLETLWRYDPLGEVVAIEGPDGAWAWTPDGYRGPEGEVLVSDRDGRAAEARPPSWPHAWSVAEEMLTVRRDPWGRMLELQGELGSVDLVFDPIGRLGAVRAPGGAAWRLDYDPRGRWSRVRTPEGNDVAFRWGTDGALLSSGSRAWVGDDLGLVAMVEDGAYAEIVRDRWGDPVALTMQGQPAVQHRASPTGYPSSDASGLAGPASSCNSSRVDRSSETPSRSIRSRGSASTDGRGGRGRRGACARRRRTSISIPRRGSRPRRGRIRSISWSASASSARRPTSRPFACSPTSPSSWARRAVSTAAVRRSARRSMRSRSDSVPSSISWSRRCCAASRSCRPTSCCR